MKLDCMKVRVCMAQLGLTGTALAERAGITRQTLSAALHGKDCSPKTVGKIAAAAEVDVSDIIEGV